MKWIRSSARILFECELYLNAMRLKISLIAFILCIYTLYNVYTCCYYIFLKHIYLYYISVYLIGKIHYLSSIKHIIRLHDKK